MLGIYPGFGKRNSVSPRLWKEKFGIPAISRAPILYATRLERRIKPLNIMYVAKETAGFDFTIDIVGQVVKVKVMLSHRALL